MSHHSSGRSFPFPSAVRHFPLVRTWGIGMKQVARSTNRHQPWVSRVSLCYRLTSLCNPICRAQRKRIYSPGRHLRMDQRVQKQRDRVCCNQSTICRFDLPECFVCGRPSLDSPSLVSCDTPSVSGWLDQTDTVRDRECRSRVSAAFPRTDSKRRQCPGSAPTREETRVLI